MHATESKGFFETLPKVDGGSCFLVDAPPKKAGSLLMSPLKMKACWRNLQFGVRTPLRVDSSI